MKFFLPVSRTTRMKKLALSLGLALSGSVASVHADPGWWDSVKKSSPPSTPNDYIPARVGHLKNFAFHAMEALDDALEPFDLPDGGAGTDIRRMIASWREDPADPGSDFKTADVNAMLNQGQLKAVAKLFYDRLAKLGLWEKGWLDCSVSGTYPAPFNSAPYNASSHWSPAPANPDEWAFSPRYPWKFWLPTSYWEANGKTTLSMQRVNIGQLKFCFNFDVEAQLVARGFISSGVPVDGDGDGVSKLVEILMGTNPASSTSVPPLALADLAEDGFTGSQPVGDAAASRFLAQATWGPTWETIAEVKTLGFDAWITQQLNDHFREPGEMMAYAWLDGSGTMPWQNVWHNWPDQSLSPDAKLKVDIAHPSTPYAIIEAQWPNHLNDTWRNTNDHYERGPYLSSSFPKRGIEPYMFYLHWRRLLLDRPIWEAQVSGSTPLWSEGYVQGCPYPWPYEVWPVWKTTNPSGYSSPADAMVCSVRHGCDEAWMRRALFDSDQLRQRVTWALSQILVVSDTSYFADNSGVGTASIAHYHDMLSYHAFGNFKDMLTAVTFHPLMAVWLTYINNVSGLDGSGNQVSIPDENYAREIMQLFSMGLDELNLDGTPKLDATGNRVPTYVQEDVRQLARLFTGLQQRTPAISSPITLPTKMNAAMHDTRAKTFLGFTIPANPGATAAQCEKEVRDAVAHIATRPSVAPFISKLLIQHLTASAPSPAYVKRVATVFRDNASASDQMGKVVRAILMDPEVRSADSYVTGESVGRLKDPMLRLVSLMRAFNAGQDYNRGRYDLRDDEQHPLYGPFWGWGHYLTRDSGNAHPYQDMAQYPFVPPSVFSFFLPGYSQPGRLANARLRSPEFQLLSPASSAGTIGHFWSFTDHTNEFDSVAGFNAFRVPNEPAWLASLYADPTIKPTNSVLNLTGKALRLNFAALAASGSDPAVEGTCIAMSPRPSGSSPTPPTSSAAGTFLDKLNILMCHGRMSATTRSRLLTLLTSASDSDYMESADGYRWERAAVQILSALPEATVLR